MGALDSPCCLRDDDEFLSVFESSFSSTPALHLYGHHVVVHQIRGPSIELTTVCTSSSLGPGAFHHGYPVMYY